MDIYMCINKTEHLKALFVFHRRWEINVLGLSYVQFPGFIRSLEFFNQFMV